MCVCTCACLCVFTSISVPPSCFCDLAVGAGMRPIAVRTSPHCCSPPLPLAPGCCGVCQRVSYGCAFGWDIVLRKHSVRYLPHRQCFFLRQLKTPELIWKEYLCLETAQSCHTYLWQVVIFWNINLHFFIIVFSFHSFSLFSFFFFYLWGADFFESL